LKKSGLVFGFRTIRRGGREELHLVENNNHKRKEVWSPLQVTEGNVAHREGYSRSCPSGARIGQWGWRVAYVPAAGKTREHK